MKICTAVVNNLIFLETQFRSIRKNVTGGEYEFIVFNDAKKFPDYSNFIDEERGHDLGIRDEIDRFCAANGIRCIPIPNDHHRHRRGAMERAADSMNFILRYQIENPDRYLILDSDMFVVDRFDVGRYEDYPAAFVLQGRHDDRVRYPWNGLYYMDFTRVKNQDVMDWNACGDCDVGGMMQSWLARHNNGGLLPPTEKIRYAFETIRHPPAMYCIHHLWSLTWDESEFPENLDRRILDVARTDPRNQNGKFFMEVYDRVFLHYRAGGNWRNEGLRFHYELSERLKSAIL